MEKPIKRRPQLAYGVVYHDLITDHDLDSPKRGLFRHPVFVAGFDEQVISVLLCVVKHEQFTL